VSTAVASHPLGQVGLWPDLYCFLLGKEGGEGLGRGRGKGRRSRCSGCEGKEWMGRVGPNGRGREGGKKWVWGGEGKRGST